MMAASRLVCIRDMPLMQIIPNTTLIEGSMSDMSEIDSDGVGDAISELCVLTLE